MLGKVDVEANVKGGGPSGQAGAVRYGLAKSLRSFVNEDMIEKMRLGKYLIHMYLFTLSQAVHRLFICFYIQYGSFSNRAFPDIDD